MIRPEKLLHALQGLHDLMVWGRWMAYRDAPHGEIADLLDWGEILPGLIASPDDETDRFRSYLEHIANRHSCARLLQRFDDPAPPRW
jgi:hypothetical protein